MLIKTDDYPTDLGYHMTDQRGSGLPIGNSGKTFIESPTYTCRHCNYVVKMNPARERPRYKCKGCSHLICDNCAAKMATGASCYTMEHQVDDYLEAVSRGTVGAEGETQLILPPNLSGV